MGTSYLNIQNNNVSQIAVLFTPLPRSFMTNNSQHRLAGWFLHFQPSGPGPASTTPQPRGQRPNSKTMPVALEPSSCRSHYH